jgi:uncharacterized cupin superfamily protein
MNGVARTQTGSVLALSKAYRLILAFAPIRSVVLLLPSANVTKKKSSSPKKRRGLAMTYQFRTNLGLVGISLIAGVALTLAVQTMSPLGKTAFAADEVDLSPPKSWTIADLNAMELEALPDIDFMPVESGSLRNSGKVLFAGENNVSLWDAGPAKLIFDEPATYDEFVLVLKGELVLSDNDGNSATYKKGDMFVVPKGFEGAWDMTEEYREFIIINAVDCNGD